MVFLPHPGLVVQKELANAGIICATVASASTLSKEILFAKAQPIGTSGLFCNGQNAQSQGDEKQNKLNSLFHTYSFLGTISGH